MEYKSSNIQSTKSQKQAIFEPNSSDNPANDKIKKRIFVIAVTILLVGAIISLFVIINYKSNESNDIYMDDDRAEKITDEALSLYQSVEADEASWQDIDAYFNKLIDDEHDKNKKTQIELIKLDILTHDGKYEDVLTAVDRILEDSDISDDIKRNACARGMDASAEANNQEVYNKYSTICDQIDARSYEGGA